MHMFCVCSFVGFFFSFFFWGGGGELVLFHSKLLKWDQSKNNVPPPPPTYDPGFKVFAGDYWYDGDMEYGERV